ncbi:MAG: hypothetical protein KDJ35_07470 [Alphaproteobacteria bacterium]|nr:hypothetical protein [Alphaproteobacteria bacterium]
MTKATIKNSFVHSSEAEKPSKNILNYVWINRKAFKSEKQNDYGVPKRYLERVIENAQRYKGNQFFLWLDQDESLLDAESLQDVKSFLAEFENIEVKNLRDLDEYASYDFFEPGKRFKRWQTPRQKAEKEDAGTVDLIWARVDLARIMVLKHCLKTLNADIAVYSDFDISDVFLKNKDLHELLNQYGLACSSGEVFMMSSDFYGAPDPVASCVENGYIAATNTPQNISFLENLIGATKEEISQKESFQPTDNGYSLFREHISKAAEERTGDRNETAFCFFKQPTSKFSDPRFLGFDY